MMGLMRGYIPGSQKAKPFLFSRILKDFFASRLHLVLFVLTMLTTTLAGLVIALAGQQSALYSVGRVGLYAALLKHPGLLFRALSYSIALLFILGFHEMGHYTFSRKFGINASLPYFIPVPPFIIFIGTLGAVIKIRSPILYRRPLVEIGAAGPIASFTLSIPITLIGLKLSTVAMGPAPEGALVFHESIIFKLLSWVAFGGSLPDNSQLILHPLAFAGWLGFFVTALNLLPIGQLDGGHLAYALLGRRYRVFADAAFILLVPLGLLWPGWWVWAVLLIILGRKHPVVRDQDQPLSTRERLLIYSSLVIFVLCFMPKPISLS